MAYDKAVDSAQLDAGLTTIADAIRAKGGTSAPLDFPQGMADAVTAISGGGDGGNTPASTIIEGGVYDCINNDATAVGAKVFAFEKIQSFSSTSVKTIEFGAFQLAPKFKRAVVPNCIKVGSQAFSGATIEIFDCSAKIVIDVYAFQNTRQLTACILRASEVCELGDPRGFVGSAVESGTGYIYVPKALVEEYKAATNWVTYADQIRAIEDYPEITGGAK